MSQFLLMHLTGLRLAIVVIILVSIQVGFLLIGAFLVPTPTFEESVPATRCLDRNNSDWLYPRGKGSCEAIDSLLTATRKVVFAFQLPLAVNNTEFEYSRWQQCLLGMLQLDTTCKSGTLVTIDARLAYRNIWDPDDAWKHYASSVEERMLDCNQQQSFQNIPLFALGSLHHNYYLLNIRLPENEINQVKDMRLLAVTQSSGFTKLWVSLKTAFFSFIINSMVTFWKRKRQLSRPLTLLEYMILFLGAALTFLNMPLEYLTLVLNMSFMLLLNDIRQNIFYAALLSFWLIFTAELLKIQDNSSSQSTFHSYWKHLTAVTIGCLLLFVSDMCQHGIQLVNPFSFTETNLALTFNILAGISASVYLFFLCYKVWKVFCNLSINHTVMPSMSVAHLLIQKRFFYRLKFLMLVTLLCALMTVTEFVVARASETYWQWNRTLKLAQTPTFLWGIYSMWNDYVCAILLFCIPICVTVTSSP